MKSKTKANLEQAKKRKKDEFYTHMDDIAQEIIHYEDHFKGKIVYCNCDGLESAFLHFFKLNFNRLGLKELITSGYSSNGDTYITRTTGRFETELKVSNGDFRSSECIELLKICDIVATNPPFSLFREYVAQLMEYEKEFIILGHINACSYKDFFQNLKDGKVWAGSIFNKTLSFTSPYESGLIKVCGVSWYTNLNHAQRPKPLNLTALFDEGLYPKYDNYDAINVDKIKDIPKDYFGVMGVPITIIGKLDNSQFEVLGLMNSGEANEGIRLPDANDSRPIMNGKIRYARILIRRIDKI